MAPASSRQKRQRHRDLTGIGQLHANQSHTGVLLTRGQARCWGFGENGQLGNGGTTDQSLPTTVRA